MLHILSRRAMLRGVAAIGALGSLPSAGVRAAETTKPRLKIGQIGVGHAHAPKLEVYRKSPDYEVVGIVEPDKDLRERASEQPAFRDLKSMTEEQLLGTPGLAAVLVETRVRDL